MNDIPRRGLIALLTAPFVWVFAQSQKVVIQKDPIPIPTTTILDNLQLGPQIPTMGLTAGGPQKFDPNAPPTVFDAQGTQSAPVSKNYRQPQVYLERWDASGPIASPDNPGYGNPWMTPQIVVEGRALSVAGKNNPNGLCVRMRAEQPGDAGVDSCLTGATFLAELNPSAGLKNYDAFALNPVVSWQNGKAPQNLVGLEVDVINAGGDSDTKVPGDSATNFTGIWLQQGAPGKIANTGIFISDSSGAGGWRYGMVMHSRFTEWAQKIENAHPSGRGLSINIGYNGDNTRAILECRCGTGVERFVVKSDGTNPVYVMVSSVLKQVFEGPPNSAQPGFKVLMVSN